MAKKVCDLLDAEGVKQQEGCLVRQMAEQMWNENYHLGLANVEPTVGLAVGGGAL